MVRTSYEQKPLVRRYADATRVPNRTIIIVYEQPKVNVVRHYSKTVVPEVNPRNYERQYEHVLLDTPALLALTRRLNIRDSFVRLSKYFYLLTFSCSFLIDRTTKISLNQSNKNISKRTNSNE